MANGKTFKKITIDDVYMKLIEIEQISKSNQIHLRIQWAIIFIILTTIIGGWII